MGWTNDTSQKLFLSFPNKFHRRLLNCPYICMGLFLKFVWFFVLMAHTIRTLFLSCLFSICYSRKDQWFFTFIVETFSTQSVDKNMLPSDLNKYHYPMYFVCVVFIHSHRVEIHVFHVYVRTFDMHEIILYLKLRALAMMLWMYRTFMFEWRMWGSCVGIAIHSYSNVCLPYLLPPPFEKFPILTIKL